MSDPGLAPGEVLGLLIILAIQLLGLLVAVTLAVRPGRRLGRRSRLRRSGTVPRANAHPPTSEPRRPPTRSETD